MLSTIKLTAAERKTITNIAKKRGSAHIVMLLAEIQGEIADLAQCPVEHPFRKGYDNNASILEEAAKKLVYAW